MLTIHHPVRKKKNWYPLVLGVLMFHLTENRTQAFDDPYVRLLAVGVSFSGGFWRLLAHQMQKSSPHEIGRNRVSSKLEEIKSKSKKEMVEWFETKSLKMFGKNQSKLPWPAFKNEKKQQVTAMDGCPCLWKSITEAEKQGDIVSNGE